MRWRSVTNREAGTGPADTGDLESAILDLLRARRNGATICPSEAARAVGGTEWRQMMQPVRDAAWRLVDAGRVIILQAGRPVKRSQARGPIRVALPPADPPT